MDTPKELPNIGAWATELEKQLIAKCERIKALEEQLKEQSPLRGNSVLIPCPKLEEMQARISELEAINFHLYCADTGAIKSQNKRIDELEREIESLKESQIRR